MLEHELLAKEGGLIVRPEGPLTAEDFAALAQQADAHIEAHGGLKGLMICTGKFPGWENLDGAESAERAAQTSHLEAELAELKSRLQTIAEISESRHEELTRATHRLGQNFTESSHKTYASFSRLNERMAVFHTALNYLAVEVRVLTSKPGLLAAKRAFRRPLHR